MCSDKRFPHVLVFLAFLQLIITCPGCSVKENRDLCPCVLELDASGDRHSGDSISLSLAGASAAADGFLLEDGIGGEVDFNGASRENVSWRRLACRCQYRAAASAGQMAGDKARS